MASRGKRRLADIDAVDVSRCALVRHSSLEFARAATNRQDAPEWPLRTKRFEEALDEELLRIAGHPPVDRASDFPHREPIAHVLDRRQICPIPIGG
jgi:hypothetical protein